MATRITKVQCEKLLSLLRKGHDLEAACVSLKLTDAQVEGARDKYAAEIATAFKVGTAKLRARIMESALSSDNATILFRLLEAREASQAADENPITEIRRIVVAGRCEHCGHQPVSRPEPGLRAPSQHSTEDRDADGLGEPGNGADHDELGYKPTITNLYNPYRSYR